MIDQLNIQNFQSHPDSELKFHPGVNVIVGNTDSGKSAIRRALEWVITNKPAGESYRSTWGGPTEVSAKMGETTVRKLKDKKSTYYLNTSEFNAFGTDVPEEIKQAFNMAKVNFQQQLDSPFLLSETPGNVALHFNKIARLDKIDRGMQFIQKNIKQFTQEISYTEKEIVEQEEEIAQFDNLDKFEINIEVLESLVVNKARTMKACQSIEAIIKAAKAIEEEISQEPLLIKAEVAIDKALQLYALRTEQMQKEETLQNMCNKIRKSEKRLKESEKVLIAESLIDKVLQLYTSRAESTQILTQIENLYASIQRKESKQEKAVNEIQELEEEFHTQFPDICPLCESKIK